MKRIKDRVTYANVVATMALFFALSGGVVYAASTLGRNEVKTRNIATHAVKSRNLAPNAVKERNLAANAVTTAKIKKEAVTGIKVKAGSLTRTNLAAGTLAGLQVAEVQTASVPGVTSEVAGGVPTPLTGTASFTPVAGKSYELLVELKGNPVDGDGAGPGSCEVFVDVLDNGAPLAGASIFSSASGTPPFNFQPIGNNAVAVGMLSPGQPQSLSALTFGSSGCGAGTAAALRATVVELG